MGQILRMVELCGGCAWPEQCGIEHVQFTVIPPLLRPDVQASMEGKRGHPSTRAMAPRLGMAACDPCRCAVLVRQRCRRSSLRGSCHTWLKDFTLQT